MNLTDTLNITLNVYLSTTIILKKKICSMTEMLSDMECLFLKKVDSL